MAYTTLAAVKRELNIATLNTDDDDLLNGYITLAQRIIEALPPLGTGRVFEAALDTTRYLDAPADSCDQSLDGPLYVLFLSGDLCSITSVVNGDGVTVASSDYVTEPRNQTPYYALRLKSGEGLVWTYDTSPEGAIAITGKWAYATSAPADIARAALRLCVWMYRSRDNAGFDQDIQTDDGLILGAKLPRDIRHIIESYWELV